jgi:hypothetical protein
MIAEIVPARKGVQSGERIEGTVTWVAEKPPRKAELRLFWHTRGKGDRDSELVETVTFELPQPSDTRPFSFRAPAYPPSFSGRLISLVWGLELVLEPGESSAIELTIGPGGKELSIDRTDWLQISELPKYGHFRVGQ